MLIGELARRSGFSRDTIRFYEKNGLIELRENERRDNNYKDYPEKVLHRLLAIKKIKAFGFTLQETRNMMILHEEGVLEDERGKRYVQRKIERINQQIADLASTRLKLEQLVNNPPQHCPLNKILAEIGREKNIEQ